MVIHDVHDKVKGTGIGYMAYGIQFIQMRILHSVSQTQHIRGLPEIGVCRIRVFVLPWAPGYIHLFLLCLPSDCCVVSGLDADGSGL